MFLAVGMYQSGCMTSSPDERLEAPVKLGLLLDMITAVVLLVLAIRKYQQLPSGAEPPMSARVMLKIGFIEAGISFAILGCLMIRSSAIQPESLSASLTKKAQQYKDNEVL